MILQELITKLGFEVNEKPLHKIEHTLEGLHHKLEFLAAVEIVKGIWELAERFAGMGENLENAAIQAGITTTEFQKLAFAASQNAVGQDELSGALAKMTRTLQKAKEGSTGAVEIFTKLGISEEQVASFRNSEDALFAVQDAIKAIDDPIARVAATTAVFGRGAAHMVKFVSAGADATKRLGNEAVAMGAVLSDQGVESLANFEDAVSGLMQVVRTFGARIGATFAPVFTAVIHDIERLWGANQKLITQNLKEWASSAAYGFGFVTEIVRVAITAFVSFYKTHPELVKGIAKVLAAFGVLSLAVSAIGFLFSGVISSFTNMVGLFKIGRPVLGAAFSLGRFGAGKLLGLLGSIMEAMGGLIFKLFPNLGLVITGLGATLKAFALNPVFLTVAGLVAAGAALGLIVQAVWAMLHGKSFWDTWLGEGLAAILKYGDKAYGFVKGIFGFKGDEAGRTEDGQQMRPFDEGLPDFVRRADDGADTSPGFFNSLLEQFGKSNVASHGTASLQALSATGLPLAMSGTQGAMAAPAIAGGNTITVNAPITINAAGGDAKTIAREAHKAVSSVMAATMREAQRDTTSAARH